MKKYRVVSGTSGYNSSVLPLYFFDSTYCNFYKQCLQKLVLLHELLKTNSGMYFTCKKVQKV